MIRKIISVLVGLAAAVIVFLIAETANAQLHPLPSSLNFNDKAAVKAFYLQQPLSLWLLVLAGWVLGSMLCGLLIKIISKKSTIILPLIAGILLTISAVANFISIPHPTWFVVIGLICFVPATILGHSLGKIKQVKS